MESKHPERYRRVVLATDGSADARTATAFLAGLAWPPETTVAVVGVCEVTVPPRSPLPVTGVEQDARRYLELVGQEKRERMRAFVAEAAAVLRERRPGVAVEELVRTGEPAAELLAQLRETGADLVVVGARGHTIARNLLLGSVSEALVAEAPCPVLIVRDLPRPPAGEPVLVGIGAVDDAERLAEAVLGLPLPAGARVVAVAVDPAPGGAPAAAERLAERLRAGSSDLVVEARTLAGDAATELMAAAEEIAADLIVVGARARPGLIARLGLGSVSRKLVRRAGRSVLVVREDEPAAGGAGR